VTARPAQPADGAAIARIYNQGIEDRTATFETRFRTSEDIDAWFDGRHPIVVVESGHSIIAFAATFTYRPRDCYNGVAEFSVYVDRQYRGMSAGRAAMQSLIESAIAAGFWKLLSRVFPENEASLKLLKSLGFREVGVYKRHGQLDGRWRDVVIIERLLTNA
jgi:L-amino acid N-acyltransferase YncA